MLPKLANFAKITASGTPGTGDITIAGAASGAFQTLASAGIGNGDIFPYVAVEGTSFERGIGTYSTTGPKIVRTKILESTNSNSAVSFTSAVVVYIDACSSELAGALVATNGDGSNALVIGAPVYVSAADTVKLAKADASATAQVIGLGYEVSTAAGALGLIVTDGVLRATTVQWDAVAGTTGGLTAGSLYYLDPATAGKITATCPTTAGQYIVKVGRALSATELLIFSGKETILISASTGSGASGNYVVRQSLTTATTMVANMCYLSDVSAAAASMTHNCPASPSTGDWIEVENFPGTSWAYKTTISGNGKNIQGANFSATSTILVPGHTKVLLRYNGTAWDLQVLTWGIIERQTASSSATIELKNWPTPIYRDFRVYFDSVLPATNAVYFLVEVSDDGGSTYKAGTSYRRTYLTQWGNTTNNSGGGATGQANWLIAGPMSNTSAKGLKGIINIYDQSTSAEIRWTAETLYDDTTQSAIVCNRPGLFYAGTLVANALRVSFSSGNIASGSFSVVAAA